MKKSKADLIFLSALSSALLASTASAQTTVTLATQCGDCTQDGSWATYGTTDLEGEDIGDNQWTTGSISWGDSTGVDGAGSYASGTNSAAGGSSNTVSGDESLAVGSGNTVSGGRSLVAGDGNTVSNARNIVGGSDNTVPNSYNLVMGVGNTASIDASAVVGTNNTAAGNRSYIGGNANNLVSTQRSVVVGDTNTVTTEFLDSIMVGDSHTVDQTRFGSFIGGSGHTIVDSDSSIIAGTGHRSEAFAGAEPNANASRNLIVGDGNTVLSSRNNLVGGEGNTLDNSAADETRDGNLVVGLNNTLTETTYCMITGSENSLNDVGDCSILAGNNNSISGAIRNSSIMSGTGIAVTTGDTAFAQNITYYGSLTNASDERLKDQIEDLSYGLDQVLELNPKSYVYKRDADETTKFGFIAQEVEQVMPELVIDNMIGVQGDDTKYKGLSYQDFTAVLVNAIQEQQAQIAELQKANEALTTNTVEFEELKAELANIKATIASFNASK